MWFFFRSFFVVFHFCLPSTGPKMVHCTWLWCLGGGEGSEARGGGACQVGEVGLSTLFIWDAQSETIWWQNEGAEFRAEGAALILLLCVWGGRGEGVHVHQVWQKKAGEGSRKRGGGQVGGAVERVQPPKECRSTFRFQAAVEVGKEFKEKHSWNPFYFILFSCFVKLSMSTVCCSFYDTFY